MLVWGRGRWAVKSQKRNVDPYINCAIVAVLPSNSKKVDNAHANTCKFLVIVSKTKTGISKCLKQASANGRLSGCGKL